MMGKKEDYMKSWESDDHVYDAATTMDTRSGKPLQFDPNFRGPIKNRSCTDVLCCLIFIIFVLGLGVVGYFGFTYGDPRLLLYPVNSEKELCGFGKYRTKPNLFFFDLVTCGRMGPGVFVDGCPTPQVCVSECPSSLFVFVENKLTPNIDWRYCKPGTHTNTSDLSALIKKGACPSYYMKSKPFFHRCVPTVLTDLLEKGSDIANNVKVANITNMKDGQNNNISTDNIIDGLKKFGQFLKAKEYGEKVIQDVVSAWWMILIGLLLACFVCLIWIILMRWIAGIMVWFAIFAFIGIFAFCSYHSITKYLATKDTEQEFHISMAVIQFSFKQAKFWLAVAIISTVILAISLLILLFLCQRIRIAIALIKEGSKAVGSMLFTLIFPVFPFVLEILTIAYWLATAVFLSSTGRNPTFSQNYTFGNGSYDIAEIEKKTSSLFDTVPCDSNVTNTLSDVCGVLKHAQEGQYTFYLQIYNLFMLFWLVNFFMAFGQMALAGAFASYYWAWEKPKDIPMFPLLSSVGRCFRYHLGTLAFGSLIVAIIQLIRVMLEYIEAKLKEAENPVAKCIIKCLKCCFWCLEKFIKFLNKNAYILTAIHGKNFCSAAKDAFLLILRNVVRVVVVDKVTDFLLFIGKLVIVGGVTAASFFFFDGRIEFLSTYKPTLNFYFVPIVIVAIGSYIVSSCFFSVYSMAVDTLFLCFLEDLERNDGSVDKPYFMPKSLKKILGKKNKQNKNEVMEMRSGKS
ncbi:hypothetical protein CHS0354_005192 [Potamilus streckersoni]|uniref:Choline transporter-like protein n=1 Tax=Potamilus streckersoni TaxID=2493646 RepID=A0AAE0RMC9_9BIVA|nr:hypothetical protein CHS0354_005192 [Potamilus streckersoni]